MSLGRSGVLSPRLPPRLPPWLLDRLVLLLRPGGSRLLASLLGPLSRTRLRRTFLRDGLASSLRLPASLWLLASLWLSTLLRRLAPPGGVVPGRSPLGRLFSSGRSFPPWFSLRRLVWRPARIERLPRPALRPRFRFAALLATV